MPLAALVAAAATMLTMRASPADSRCGSAACEVATAVRRFTAYSRSQVATVPCSSVSQRKAPATLTSASSRPCWRTTASMARPAATGSERSTSPTHRACARVSSGVGANARSSKASFAPSRTTAWATACPRLPNAPVMATTLPRSFMRRGPARAHAGAELLRVRPRSPAARRRRARERPPCRNRHLARRLPTRCAAPSAAGSATAPG